MVFNTVERTFIQNIYSKTNSYKLVRQEFQNKFHKKPAKLAIQKIVKKFNETGRLKQFQHLLK